MQFFIDTANVDDIKNLLDTGFVDGVTTNPSLIAKSGRKIHKVIEEICRLVEGPVSAEVTATDLDGMLAEGRFLAQIAPNVAVKVPLTPTGLKACRILSTEGTAVNVTLCFSSAQALLAAKAGATFISPFIGRLDDIGVDGATLIDEICTIYDQYPDLDTQVLAASIRTPMHVIQAATAGADIATIPPKVLHQLYQHPLTDKGLDMFLADWADTGQTVL